MEQVRMLLAIVLSFVVFLVWQVFFVDKQPMEKPGTIVESQEQLSKMPPVEEQFDVSSGTAPVDSDAASIPSIKRETLVTVNTPLYQVKIAGQGALFKSLTLKRYRETADEGSENKELIREDNPYGTVETSFYGNVSLPMDQAVYKTVNPVESLDVTDRPEALSLVWRSPEGIVVEKKFTFRPDTYAVDLDLIIKNGTSRSVKGQLGLSLNNWAGESEGRYGFVGPSGLIDNKMNRVKIKDIDENNLFSGDVDWIAIQDRYFISALIARQAVNAKMKLDSREGKWLKNTFLLPEANVNPGTMKTFEYQLFFGPKSMAVLKTVGHGLEKAVNFGMFDFIAKPCLWLMNVLYKAIPNYGVAIIILTVLIKIVLWPLGTKSYKSMNEMKRLQPLMAELREKYKDDKKKMNEEIMGLYKLYKINPMGGCLPMVMQIPVFFALYRMLYEAIELRHAPFLGWINDLSAPDRLFHFGFSIPFMQPPYGIPVLTIVMGATMFLQQKMSPAPGDPNQAKMMMLMPLFFTVIFINFSSGLVLYWLVNNILSVSQQYYISKKYA